MVRGMIFLPDKMNPEWSWLPFDDSAWQDYKKEHRLIEGREIHSHPVSNKPLPHSIALFCHVTSASQQVNKSVGSATKPQPVTLKGPLVAIAPRDVNYDLVDEWEEDKRQRPIKIEDCDLDLDDFRFIVDFLKMHHLGMRAGQLRR